MENPEEKLKAVFGELKADDLRQTPLFQAVKQKATRRASSAPEWFIAFRVPLATVSLVAAVAFFAITVHVRRLSSAREMQEWVILSNWQATTDALLSVTNPESDSSSNPVHAPIDPR